MTGFYDLKLLVTDLSEQQLRKIETRTYPDALVTVFNNDDVVYASTPCYDLLPQD